METKNLNPIQSENVETNRKTAAPPPIRRSGWGSKLLLLMVVVIAGSGMFFFVRHRGEANAKPEVQAMPSVAVAKVVRQDLYNEVPIPAEFRAYVQSELHAMVTGYVSKMDVDFGDQVKEGQELATIEVPELTDQLHNAMATQDQAQADYDNAHLIYTRLENVAKQNPKLVAQQDIDTAKSKDASAAAAIGAAKANVEKYQTLMNYTKITAPFDGVITERSVDPGALVQAGTSTDKSQSLVRISDNYHLRLDFPVSVEYVKDVRVGDPVNVRVDSLGGKVFTGKITRFTNKVNDQTRTMMTELELENPTLEIIPGMYAVVLFEYQKRPNALAIPTEAVGSAKESVVYVINAANEIESRKVKLGLEMPDKYEVTDGLKEGELVMIGNRSQVHPGEKVEPKLVEEPTVP